MKPSKLREMSREDLIHEEEELRAQLFKLRFEAATELISDFRLRIAD